MITPTISIIIPTYNGEQYIRECLMSVVDCANEIIVIDDGSTDLSLSLVGHFRNHNIKVISQNNQGLAASRNQGLEAATCEYVAFLDCDDVILAPNLTSMLDKTRTTKSDIIVGNTLYFDRSIEAASPKYIIPPDILLHTLNGADALSVLMDNDCYNPMCQNYLFRRQFLIDNNAKFISVMHEDEIWTIQRLIQAKTVELLGTPFYLYRQHPKSMVHTNRQAEKRALALISVCKHLFQFSQSTPMSPHAQRWILSRILWMSSIAVKIQSHYKANLFDDKILSTIRAILKEASSWPLCKAKLYASAYWEQIKQTVVDY